MGWNSAGFEIGNMLDRRAFPTARRNRTGPPLSAGAGTDPSAPAAGPLPQTRAFWFELRTNATSRTTISTSRLRGPCLVREIQWGISANPDALNWYLDVGKAPNAVAEVNVAVALVRPWTSLFNDMVPRSANVSANLTGMPSRSVYGAVGDDRWPIHQLITDAEFFLVLSVLNNTAGVRITHGTLYLVENIPLDQVPFYL